MNRTREGRYHRENIRGGHHGPNSHAGYMHGASTAPLIGETIGVRFDKVASRWSGSRDALIVRHQHLRWSLLVNCGAGSTRSPPGFWRSGSSQEIALGIWSPNNPPKPGGDAIRHRQGQPRPRQYQSGLPARAKSNTRLTRVGCKALIHRARLQEQARICEHAARIGARD